jgi:Flp pilus assembly protein TadG
MVEVRKRLRAVAGDAGAELIELAIVLPLLLVVFAAIIDFAFLFQRYEVVTNAAREGARVGILDGYTEADIDARVLQYLAASGVTAVADDCDVAYSTPVLTGTRTIRVVTVTVDHPVSFTTLGPIIGLIGGSFYSSITVRGVSTMRTEVQ